jgi:Domain of Unknown Function (DUF930)
VTDRDNNRPDVRPRKRFQFRTLLLLSFILHGLVVAIWAVIPAPVAIITKADVAISVTLVAPALETPALPAKPEAAQGVALPMAEPVPVNPQTRANAPQAEVAPLPADIQPPMIRPQTMLAAKSLNDRRSASARAAMKTLAPEEQLIQLCNVEAMEQVAAWKPGLKPQQLVAYALADPEIDSNSVNAKGAAILTKNQWLKLEYECLAEPSSNRVVSFSFRLGDPIPQEDQVAHNLASPGSALDQ